DGLADTTTWREMLERHPTLKLPAGATPDQPFVQILDPATGTGTFLEMVIDVVHEHLNAKWRDEGLPALVIRERWSKYAAEHLLPRLYGFELMMAPYAIAHMKIGLKLKHTGYDFASSQRVRVYLTNTLEPPASTDQTHLDLPGFIAHEANEASEVKAHVPTTVILGNPPYSGVSSNNGPWIHNLLRTALPDGADGYFRVDGKPLGERNPKWLNDDYVKFIRFAQRQVARAGTGVLGFITNHGYLDNPTFRGMRQSLTQTFKTLRFVDLHGNLRRRALDTGGQADENVFDIQQGVAVALLARTPQPEPAVNVVLAHLAGPREPKYTRLSGATMAGMRGASISLARPFYSFAKQDGLMRAEYLPGWSLTRVFPVNVLGFQTHRDDFAVAFDRSTIGARVKDLLDARLPTTTLRDKYDLNDNRDWNLSEARKVIQRAADPNAWIIECGYRPFDTRWCLFSNVAMDYPRRELLDNVAKKRNLCLLSSRQQGTEGYKHSWVTRAPANDCMVSTASREANQVFPLFLYGSSLFGGSDANEPSPNLNNEFLAGLARALGVAVGQPGFPDPETIVAYCYALLNAPSYRARYAEFLKEDFPRIPLTTDRGLFDALCHLGGRLVGLHLLEVTPEPLPGLAFSGSDRFLAKVGERGRALADVVNGAGRVSVNGTSGFASVPEDAWAFEVGGFQVLHKWLDDRRKAGRSLSDEDVEHYRKMVAAIAETIRIMGEIDETIEAHGGWPLAGSVPEGD
ncbi:MAG TPA: type ISP restriction/modification enzyme, partial [Deinococcales bacterium]|nr:type ISP restriction/modification enzyme [Deinococcales bacterium]